jgi:ATP synthase protein I
VSEPRPQDEAGVPGPQDEAGVPGRQLGDAVARRAARRRRAEREARRSIWFSLGLFGIVGWSVSVPTLAGLAAGLWLDARFPGRLSWTLTLLTVGIVVGCLNAWYWIRQESRGDDEGGSDHAA